MRKLTRSQLRNEIHYDKETGIFTWKNKSIGRKQIVGSDDGRGYIRIYVLGKRYKAHQLAFLYMTGSIPSEIDHINRIRNDNRWCNLKASTHSENMRNRWPYVNDKIKMNKRNKTGVIGVSWNTARRKYVARITIDGKGKHIGCYDSFIDAVNARKIAAEKAGFCE
jgi:hypothetical protein